MRANAVHSAEPLSDATYIELVASLCATRMPAAIMSSLFVLIGGLAAVRTHDALTGVMLVIGIGASVARLAILFSGRRFCDASPMTLAATKRFERQFGTAYIAFAAVLGCLAARVLLLPFPTLHLPIVILIVGYAAGVAATIGLRPRIAIPSLLLAVMPAAMVMGRGLALENLASTICLDGLSGGALRSMNQRYRSQAAKTAKRQAFALLARSDHLTGLDNRLALAEAGDRMRQENGEGLGFAVHYIDLDDFKPVNDRLGHQAGDAILRCVADRLSAEIAPGDIVARLGGDEFVFVQDRVASPVEVIEKAALIERLLGMPFDLDGRSITVGATVGSSAIASYTTDMDDVLREADEALLARKKAGRTRRAISQGPFPENHSTPTASCAHRV
jgi:diguanylate cyclase (GGDEF)-like protein